MIILAPGCTHFDRIDPRTKRKMNLCYRTYRLQARCVFEMFCAFLTTRGGVKARPALLVRSGTGTPNWISTLECLKLAVGTSIFECCETNHIRMKTCRQYIVEKCLRRIIYKRVETLFHQQEVEAIAEARVTVCCEQWWLRNLPGNEVRKCKSALNFRQNCLRWRQDERWFDRARIPILAYAAMFNEITVMKDLLEEVQQISNEHQRSRCLQSRVRKEGLPSLGVTGHITALIIATGFANVKIVSLLLEHGADPYVMFKDKA